MNEGHYPPFGRGQIEIRRTGGKEELGLPLSQAKWFAFIGVCALFVLLVDAVIVGPMFGVVGMSIVLVALWWVGLRYVGHYSTLVALGIGAAWLVTGYGIVSSVWPAPLLRVSFQPWVIGLVLLVSIPLLTGCSLIMYRLAYEIIDPNWPPTLAQRDPGAGIAWPGKRVLVDDEDVVEEPPAQPTMELEEIRAILTQVLEAQRKNVRERIILLNGHSTGLEENKPKQISMELINGAWHWYKDDNVPVPVEDLKRLVRLGATMQHGMSSRAVNATLGLGEDAWRSAMITLEGLGIVERRGARKATCLCVTADEGIEIIDDKLQAALASPTDDPVVDVHAERAARQTDSLNPPTPVG